MIVYYNNNLEVTEEEDSRRVCLMAFVNPDSNKVDYRIKMSELGLFNPFDGMDDRAYRKRNWKWVSVSEDQKNRYVHFIRNGSQAVMRSLEREIRDA